MKLYDPRICALGEGALWHPKLKTLFWFDILGKSLLSADGRQWHFSEHVSAAGWINDHQLIIATETALCLFDLQNAHQEYLIDLEANNPITRSNDGRTDPYGGFWIGTMGKNLEADAGAIYRFYKGNLRKIFDKLTIPNAICFSPDKAFAYFTDTPCQQIMCVKLDQQGWPINEPKLFIDLVQDNLNPDGAVIDSNGYLWNAQWGASRIACYDQAGTFIKAVSLPVSQVTCPAFGAGTLFATTAADGLQDSETNAGCVFAMNTDIIGQTEHQFLL